MNELNWTLAVAVADRIGVRYMPTASVEPASQRNAARVKVRDKQTNLNMIENMLIYFYLSVVGCCLY